MSDHGPGPVGPANEPGASRVGPPAAPAPSHAWATPQPQPTQPTPSYSGYGGQPLPAPGAGTPSTDAWPNTPYSSPAFPQGSHGTTAFPGGPPAAPRRAGRLRIGLAGLVAGAVIGGGAGAGVATLVDEPAARGGTAAAAQNVVIENPETATTATAAAAKAAPSVVTVYVSSSSASGSGSGVVLTADGFVLTNNHVVAGDGGDAGTVQVRTADGSLYDASIVGTDPASDLAVLRLDGAGGLTPAAFADSDEVQVGDVAVAIGAPLGLSNTVTTGIVSATDRAVATGSTEDDATVIDAIQTDAAINPGNSGGALVDGAGEVIGINTAIATVASGAPGSQSQSGNIGVGFAIPGNAAQRIAQEIIETGSATRALLGVRARTDADDQNSEVGAGARVETVEPGSPAAEAGLEPGDVVTAVGERPVTTSTELTAAVRSQAPGEEVTLTVRRDGESRTVEVTLGTTG
ncbi:PDZ domain-containing protein [Blastococcus sp. CT_GayMR19]|uniref:S1C family serine protease n=1 Tax=Blastococcus sp. CT_GayMR19 TaxID=2559608 RepID=UPI0010743E27|nr:trypsin-like peptidase domain-containing protein [Blastococcus sp. CT_GayMR19]TFV73344.1 PDZ domain-containing protein [Blastococcus sp. CT_GayMR19]